MPDIAPFERTDDESGKVYVRNAAVLALFIDRPVHELSAELAALADGYARAVPAGALRWAVPSASAEGWKPLDDKIQAKCRALLEPEGARKRKLTAFHFNDAASGAPSYAFDLVGRPMGKEFPGAMTWVQMTFPVEWLNGAGVESLVGHVRQFAGAVPLAHGYCAPSLVYAASHLFEAYTAIRGLALRHPGYDVHNNQMAALTNDGRVRGARWISLLGPALVARLGGVRAIEAALPAPIVVEPLGAALMVRAGTYPEIGDVNRRAGTPLLRQVARLLEPVTQFDESTLLFSTFDEDDGFLSRWERRLLD